LNISCETIQKTDFPESGFYYGYIIVTIAFLIMSVLWGVFYTFGVFFKPMLKEFGWTRAVTAGTFSLCSVTQGLLSIVMGGLTDRYGPRIVMTISGLLLGIGYLLMAYVNNVWQFYLFYGLILGIGMGGSFVPLVSTVARWFVERRGMMTGIVAAGVGMGAFVGPPVASRLISIYGWRASYVMLGSIVLIVIVLCAQFIKRGPAQIGLNIYNKKGESKKITKQESKSLSLREACHTTQFWVFFIMIVCLGFCVFAMMVHIVPHATEIGISAISAANILATIGGLSIIGKVFFGRIGDRIGSRLVFIIAFTLLSASLFWLVPAKSSWALYLFAAAFGLAYGGGVTSESPLVAELFGLRYHGLMLGVIAFGFTFGGAIGPVTVGYMFDVTGSYLFAFLVCAIVSSAGLISAFILKWKRQILWI
jgi:MFS family permease